MTTVLRYLAEDQLKRFSGTPKTFENHQRPKSLFGITPDYVKTMPECKLLTKTLIFLFCVFAVQAENNRIS